MGIGLNAFEPQLEIYLAEDFEVCMDKIERFSSKLEEKSEIISEITKQSRRDKTKSYSVTLVGGTDHRLEDAIMLLSEIILKEISKNAS